MNDGKTRPVDARALTFLHRFDALTTVVDAKDYGLGNAVDSSVITYFNPMMHTAVFRVYAEELSYVRQHPLTCAAICGSWSTKRSTGINRPMLGGGACPSPFLMKREMKND